MMAVAPLCPQRDPLTVSPISLCYIIEKKLIDTYRIPYENS